MMNWDYIKKEAIHTGFGAGCALIVAGAAYILSADSAGTLTLVGLGAVLLRTTATICVVVFSPYVLKSKNGPVTTAAPSPGPEQ
jgi:hypothetical protein